MRKVALGVLVTMLLLPLSACIRVSDLHVNSADLVLIPGIAGEYFDSIDNNYACVGQPDGNNYRVWSDKNRSYGAKTRRVAFMSIGTASDGTRIFLGLDMGGTSAELFELQVSNGALRWGVLDFKTEGPGILEFVRRLKNQYNLVISGTSIASLTSVKGSVTSAQILGAFRDEQIRKMLTVSNLHRLEKVPVNLSCAQEID